MPGNAEIARMLAEMGDILEVQGESAFKVRAYRLAAQVVGELGTPAAELVAAGTLTDLPGIGPKMAAKIVEMVREGSCVEHQQLQAQVPPGVLSMLAVEGVGPRTAAAVWHALGITDVDALEAACRDGRILAVPRMGASRAGGILAAIERHRKRSGRTPLYRAMRAAEMLLSELRRRHGVIAAEACGSLRRRQDTVGDVDLLAASRDPLPVMRAFCGLAQVDAVLGEGSTKSSIRLHDGLQVDLRVVPPQSFGAALQYFTGSKTHNIALRARAVRRGWKLNEYGLFDEDDRMLAGEREEDVYGVLGLPWIAPELREGAGEIEAAEDGTLPHLLQLGDLRGDLHDHSTFSSDGRSTMVELQQEARRLGLAYLAITDHSRSRPLGLDAAALSEQRAELRALERAGRHGPRLLHGIEVDILADGSLDLPLDVLATLDWVVASVHSRFNDPPERLTARMIAALRSGVVDVLGHPSGRIIGRRDPYDFDLGQVLEAAREAGAAVELNASPDRLDLCDRHCRLAREAGVPVVISTDAHHTSSMDDLRYGVWVARRAWLEPHHVLNTSPCDHLMRFRRRRRAQGVAQDQHII